MAFDRAIASRIIATAPEQAKSGISTLQDEFEGNASGMVLFGHLIKKLIIDVTQAEGREAIRTNVDVGTGTEPEQWRLWMDNWNAQLCVIKPNDAICETVATEILKSIGLMANAPKADIPGVHGCLENC